MSALESQVEQPFATHLGPSRTEQAVVAPGEIIMRSRVEPSGTWFWASQRRISTGTSLNRSRLVVVLPTSNWRSDDEDLLDIASEPDERGLPAAAAALSEGLRVRFAHNRAALASLAALQHYYLPALIDASTSRAPGLG